MRHLMIALLAVAAAGPAAAQEWQVARETFTFVGTRLTIHVDAEPAGTLRVIRGGPGTVRVAGRAATGFTSAGLDARGQLTLAAAGAGPVDYMVSVPDQVWVDVRLPGRAFGETMGGQARSRTFEWPTAGIDRQTAVEDWLPPLHHDEPLYTTYAAAAAPAVIRLPELVNVRSISVRIQGQGFRVSTSRPLTVDRGSDHVLEIRPAPPAMDIVVTLPAQTRSFRLEAASHTALTLQDGDLATLCSPVTRQELSDGRRWVTFNPSDGALECTAPATPRHEG